MKDMIITARSAAYAIMGAGLHGDSVNPVIGSKMITTYVTLILLYGLDAVVLNKQEIENLDIFHRDLLRQIQGLYDNTANIAVYLLSGPIPVETDLNKHPVSLWSGHKAGRPLKGHSPQAAWHERH